MYKLQIMFHLHLTQNSENINFSFSLLDEKGDLIKIKTTEKKFQF